MLHAEGVWIVFNWIKRMGWRVGAFALMALLVRAMVPAGYMLAEADTGSGRYLTLELCDAHGSTPQVIDLETGKIIDLVDDDGSSEPPQQACVFAGVFASTPPVSSHEPVTFAVERDVHFGVVRDLRPGRGIAAPPPPSTGPPSFI
jgi:hypothetical protein